MSVSTITERQPATRVPSSKIYYNLTEPTLKIRPINKVKPLPPVVLPVAGPSNPQVPPSQARLVDFEREEELARRRIEHLQQHLDDSSDDSDETTAYDSDGKDNVQTNPEKKNKKGNPKAPLAPPSIKTLGGLGKLKPSMVAQVQPKDIFRRPSEVPSTSRPQVLVQGITEWVLKWLTNNWKTNDNRPVKNQRAYEKLMSALKHMDVIWEHVPGHEGIDGNENADRLAREGALMEPESESSSSSSSESLEAEPETSLDRSV
ncbi:uncharacterized protein LOC127282324 [Leptopilina boulardi]|uniref:uncharacterized protein LOC127282324 n=1 Tax=Leptopilina boulardi TaxID=63433 RepID=UPI0021F5F5DB|nr:uncharacterized protein LOC127282324 [Leptopilina boulardi]